MEYFDELGADSMDGTGLSRYGLDLKADAAAHFELFKKWQESSSVIIDTKIRSY